MRSWQDRGEPFFEVHYTALTHHSLWDGGRHYWPGMPVKGMDDQDPANPHCCQELALYEGEEVQLDKNALVRLRRGLRHQGHTHKGAGDRMGMGLARMRQRLYGKRPLTRNQLVKLCVLANIEPGEFSSPTDHGELTR
jgi:hypothetical protein